MALWRDSKKVKSLDLSGEWRVEFNAYAVDTLFINNNGFYVQYFTDSAIDYGYVSEPGLWYLEEVPGGGMKDSLLLSFL